jgi:hypothetical protein
VKSCIGSGCCGAVVERQGFHHIDIPVNQLLHQGADGSTAGGRGFRELVVYNEHPPA